MRNLMLFLIAFIAIVTFIRAFEKVDARTINNLSKQPVIEAVANN